MPHVPFARKYRPQTFEELVGQAHVTATLARAMASQRLGQAYLFAGPRGVGKTSAARILAKSLNCAQGASAGPCNRCGSCEQITGGHSLDVLEIDGASNRGIDEIRSLRETVAFAPTAGAFRIYIIDEVHMLTLEAFNALLKTLEEPPAHVKFIFATTMPAKVPPTILSRCQRFEFRRLDAAVIVQALRRIAKGERLKIDEPALYAIARAADGSLRDAEVVLEQLASFSDGPITEAAVTELLGVVGAEALAAWAQAILERQPAQSLERLREQLAQGKEPAQLLASLLHHLRNLLVVRSVAGGPDEAALAARLVDEPAERLESLRAQASLIDPQELLFALQLLAGAADLMRRSSMAQTVLELAVIKLATREQWQSLDAIRRQLEQLSGGTPRPAEAVPSVKPASPPAAAASKASSAEVVPVRREAPVAMVAPEAVAAIWPAFLERLGERKMSLAAYLADAKPLEFSQGILTVGVSGSALHQEVLSQQDHRRLIEQLLEELSGQPLRIAYTALPEAELIPAAAPSAPSAPVPPMVHDIVRLFNATVLESPPPPSPA